jgi:hypothetical protein
LPGSVVITPDRDVDELVGAPDEEHAARAITVPIMTMVPSVRRCRS